MKKRLCLIFLCGLIIFGVCGCDNNDTTKESSNETMKNTEVKEDIDSKENENDTKDNNNNEDINVNDKEEIKKEETKPTTSNNTSTTNDKKQETKTKQETTTSKEDTTTNDNTNKEEEKEIIDTPKEEPIILPKEELNKKIVVCSIKQEGSYYYGTTTHTTTFENDTIIHDKMYSEKHFKDGYKAEEDSWTISNIKAIENNTKVGISGNAYIENNITYLTINYDIKANPNLIGLITKHTEYNDFLNHMTNNNGYSCTTK